VRKHSHVTELTPTLLNELVERIEVYAPDKSSGKRTQRIEVRFHFVGLIGELDFMKSERPVMLVEAKAGQAGSKSGKP
jgi:hypothetical protein